MPLFFQGEQSSALRDSSGPGAYPDEVGIPSVNRGSFEVGGSASADYRFTDLSQTAPAGRYRLRTTGDTVVLQRAASATLPADKHADWSGSPVTLATWVNTGAQTITATDAATNSVTQVLTLDHESTAAPVAGYGAGLTFMGKSATVASRIMATIEAAWTTATDATRASDLVFYTVVNTAKTEIFRIVGATSNIQVATGSRITSQTGNLALDAPGNAVDLYVRTLTGHQGTDLTITTSGGALFLTAVSGQNVSIQPAGAGQVVFPTVATTGVAISATNSTLTSGQMLNLTLSGTSVVATAASTGSILTLAATTTGWTGATQRLGMIVASGVNTTASAVVTGLAISVINTGTTNTNIALTLTASGASAVTNPNVALNITAGVLVNADATDAASTITGSAQFAGGVGIVKKLYTGSSVFLTGLSAAGAGTALVITGGNEVIPLASMAMYKDHWKPITGSDRVLDLIPGDFDWNALSGTPGVHDIGLRAEDVAKVYPELVTYRDGKPYGVKYMQLAVPILAVVKRLQDRILVLEAR